jgi:antitoxin component YwqK of YwqJK toxin-antitoxin module
MRISLSIFIAFVMFTSFGQVNQVDSKGRKQGKWEKIYEGTRVFQYKGQFKDDKPVGKFSYFYKSSKTKAVVKHDENSNRSVAYYYHENGAVMSYGIFRDQKKDSVWINFGPSQRLSNTETYVNGQLHGKKVVYYVPEDITNKSQVPSAVYMYNRDELDGEFTEYFNDLVVRGKGQYKMGIKTGMWYTYHTNGRKMTLTRYKNGVRHGWCKAFDGTGKEKGSQYYYYGEHLEGKKLKRKMEQLKELGINPNS